MNKITRREALTGILATGAATLVASGGVNAEGILQTETLFPSFAGKHQPKPLPFDATKLTGISEKLITSHHDNNYVGAVKALNVVETRLAAMMKDKDLPVYLYGDLKRQELIRTGSIVLHEKYFANLGGNGKADGTALKTIKNWWGSYEAWEAEFKKPATHSAAVRAGRYLPTTATQRNFTITGRPTTRPIRRSACRCSCSICTNTRIRWITAPPPPNTSTRL